MQSGPRVKRLEKFQTFCWQNKRNIIVAALIAIAAIVLFMLVRHAFFPDTIDTSSCMFDENMSGVFYLLRKFLHQMYHLIFKVCG